MGVGGADQGVGPGHLKPFFATGCMTYCCKWLAYPVIKIHIHKYNKYTLLNCPCNSHRTDIKVFLAVPFNRVVILGHLPNIILIPLYYS